MRKFLLICSLALLAGCPGPGDRLPDVQNAKVDLKSAEPCLTYAVTPGDRISSIQIGSNSGESDSFRKSLGADKFLPDSNKCLPTFGYRFMSGKQYVIYYSVDNDSSSREKIILGRFTMVDNK